jgi:hypothetical protein
MTNWCKNNQTNSETDNTKTNFSLHAWQLQAKQMETDRSI